MHLSSIQKLSLSCSLKWSTNFPCSIGSLQRCTSDNPKLNFEGAFTIIFHLERVFFFTNIQKVQQTTHINDNPDFQILYHAMHGDNQDGKPFLCMQGFEPTMLKDWQWEDHSDGLMSLMDVINGNMSDGACTQGKLLMAGMKWNK